MKHYAVFSEGMNVFMNQRVFKTKRAAQRNLESFFACTIGHDAEIREIEKPSYAELEQEIQKLKADREVQDRRVKELEEFEFMYNQLCK
jgi:hypothetical protein